MLSDHIDEVGRYYDDQIFGDGLGDDGVWSHEILLEEKLGREREKGGRRLSEERVRLSVSWYKVQIQLI